jgi:hypothetical protein
VSTSVNLIGLFRSGTNYVRTLLEWNYDVTVNYDGYGWKHAVVPTFTNASRFTYPEGKTLVVVKNPYAVLLSWYKYATSNGRNIRGDTSSFGAFIRNRIYYRDDFNKSLAPEYYFPNPVQMWNSVVWNHVSVAEQTGGFIVEYEDVLRSPEGTSARIAHKLGLNRKSDEFVHPQNVVRNMGDRGRRNERSRYVTKREFDSSYYLDKEYVREYCEDDLVFVTGSLDAEVIERAGIKISRHGEGHFDISAALYTASGD